MSEIPFRHGKAGPSTTGYRKGCRCEGCRRSKREDQAAYRAKVKLATAGPVAVELGPPPEVSPSSAAINWAADPGDIETALVEEIAKLIGEPPFKKTLIVLAKYNARVLDQLPQMERLDLVSGMQTRLFNVFDRLRYVQAAPGATTTWDVSALTATE